MRSLQTASPLQSDKVAQHFKANAWQACVVRVSLQAGACMLEIRHIDIDMTHHASCRSVGTGNRICPMQVGGLHSGLVCGKLLRLDAQEKLLEDVEVCPSCGTS